LLEGCWTVAGKLLEGWKYSSQRKRKSMKHEKRQKYVRTSKAIGLEAYKQTW